MVIITFPDGDYEAADIAIKVEVTVGKDNAWVIPKFMGRNKYEIEKQIKKSDAGILIVNESKQIDKGTLEEINLLLKRKLPLFVFLPYRKNIKIPKNENIIIFRYGDKDKDDVVRNILDKIKEIKSKKTSKTLLEVVLLLAFSLLLANIITRNE